MQDLSQILSKLKFKKTRKNFGFGSSPEADWKFILIAFMVFVFMVVVACGYFFLRINAGDIFVATAPTEDVQSSSININSLKSTLDHYKNKAAEFERIKITPETILDPSR